MRIIFWGKYLDAYLVDTLNQFQSGVGNSIQYALVEEKNIRRGMPGRDGVNPGAQNVFILPQKGLAKAAKQMIKENGDAVHLFLSFWGDKRLFLVLLYALWHKLKVAVILEPYSETPLGYWKEESWLKARLKVLARKFAYRAAWPLFQLFSRDKLPCVLAISPLAEQQLLKAGFSRKMVFPYAYFIEKKDVTTHAVSHELPLRVVYSGSLIRRKGLDVAIAALQKVNQEHKRVSLDIYGPGEIRRFLDKEYSGIQYKGTYPQQDAQKTLSQYDLLLVPSRHEGWGVVVNEALMQGVPAIVSDRVGAKCLVEGSGAGLVFRNEDSAQLADLLLKLVEDKTQLALLKSKCGLIRDRITLQIGADYLERVLNSYFHRSGGKPHPIWLTQD